MQAEIDQFYPARHLPNQCMFTSISPRNVEILCSISVSAKAMVVSTDDKTIFRCKYCTKNSSNY